MRLSGNTSGLLLSLSPIYDYLKAHGLAFEVGQVQGEVPRVSKESRKKLASLSFSEKVKLLEKLRQRSLSLAEARKKLKEKTASGKSSTDS